MEFTEENYMKIGEDLNNPLFLVSETNANLDLVGVFKRFKEDINIRKLIISFDESAKNIPNKYYNINTMTWINEELEYVEENLTSYCNMNLLEFSIIRVAFYAYFIK